MGLRCAWAGLAALAVLAVTGAPALGDADSPGQSLPRSEVKAQTGVVRSANLGDGSVHLDLTNGYTFIQTKDVQPILNTMKAPAPTMPMLGAVAPAGKRPGQADYWLAVLTYQPIGNVPETGNDEMTSMSFINNVKASRPANPPLEIFAVAPSYDYSGSKTLTWGEKYTPTNAAPNSLRYEQRVLGRSGVAGITLIARPNALDKARQEGKAVRSMLTFNLGQRYADFRPSTDKVAQYNLPGLIDGKPRVAAQTAVAASVTPPADSSGTPMTLADFMPGGKYMGVSFVAAGLLALGVLYGLVKFIFTGNEDKKKGPPPRETT
jgi:uncharacterized membrane-anchored protein